MSQGMGRLARAVAAPTSPLADAEWDRRHRRLALLLAVQAAVVLVWAVLARGAGLHAAAHAAGPLAWLVLANAGRAPRVVRACAMALGLFTVSATAVHLADGAVAAHFHYFVVLVLLAQYEDARPFALGVVTVVVQHGVFGALLPGSAFPEGTHDQWTQAGVHGAFVLAAAVGLVVNWRANEALRRREEQARRATEQVLEVAGAVLVSLDREGRVRDANPRAEEVLGRLPAGTDFFAQIGREQDRDAFAAHIAGAVPDPQRATVEVGSRTLLAHAALTRDASGRVDGVLLSGEDITVQLRASEALRRERDDLALLRRVTHDLLEAQDGRGVVVAGAAELFGARAVSLWEPSGAGVLARTSAHGDAGEGRPVAVDDPGSGVARAWREGRLHLGDGAAVGGTSAAFQPVRGGERVRGVLVVAWEAPRSVLGERTTTLLGLLADDLTVALERLEAQHRLEAAAMTDPLTGVPNRRAWDEALARELDRARRTARPLAVALLDLNEFKARNDREGHEAGDQLLKACAAAWAGTLRSTDVLARLGGDEFGVLLPDCTPDEAVVVARRLREATPHGPGAGVGLAVWDGGEDARALLRRADAALYEDKASGAWTGAGAPSADAG
jgi:diguanylate cyclase (GGDEF)-like protein